MNVSIEKLLTKIEEELKLAKSSGKLENLREKVYSIKILCELILDEQQPSSKTTLHKIGMNQPKQLEVDNEANGDSLLDF